MNILKSSRALPCKKPVLHTMRYISILFLLSFCTIISAANYYVGNNGNDSDDGLTPASAWRTIGKVNSQELQPGDSVLFERGSAWYENLTIRSSGTGSARIVYDAFGDAKEHKPIISNMSDIPGWNITGNWTYLGNNVWRLSWRASILTRIIIDGKEKKRVVPMNSNDVTEENPWSLNFAPGETVSDHFYLYSRENPAVSFSSMHASGANFLFVDPTGVEFITLRNLDFEGWRRMRAYSCSHWTVEHCNIGRFFSEYGFSLFTDGITHSTNWIIRYNTFDTGDRLDETIYYPDNQPHGWYRTADGLQIRTGNSNHLIHNNHFMGWGHSAIEIRESSSGNALPIENIRVFNNYFTTEWQTYGRAMVIDGLNLATFSENNPIRIYNNYIHEQGVRSQIQAPYVMIYNNIFDGSTGQDNNPNFAAELVSINNYRGGRPFRMRFFNNIFAHAGGDGFAFYCFVSSVNNAEENEFINNIFYENGRHLRAESSTKLLNNVFKNNIFHTSKDNRIRFHIVDIGTVYRTIEEFNALIEGDPQENPSNWITSGNIEADPLFVDPANGDFRLQDGSPAIGAGLDVGLPFTGNAPDIGALPYEPATGSAAKPPHSPTRQMPPRYQMSIRGKTVYLRGLPPDAKIVVMSSAGRAVGAVSAAHNGVTFRNVARGTYLVAVLSRDGTVLVERSVVVR